MSKISIDFKTGKLKSNSDHVVGIDLGTTNSLIACTLEGRPTIIPIGDKAKKSMPSAVWFNKEGIAYVGDEALTRMHEAPMNMIYSFKRFMGKSYQDLINTHSKLSYAVEQEPDTNEIVIPVASQAITAIALSSFILKELKTNAENYLKCSISKVVITVPAYFNDHQRQATREAGKLAGLDVLRIINEPTAAAMAYGLGIDPNQTKHIMVYDLGGGTFDVSILRIENGVFDILSTHGDNMLGGDDIDQEIVRFWENQYKIDSNPENKAALRTIAEQAKIFLLDHNLFKQSWLGIELSLNTENLEQLASNWINKTIKSCQLALKDSGLNPQEIDEIILVGGSSRLSLVKRKLTEHFNRPINDFLNPEEVVALGAAIQAEILQGNRNDWLLLDVNPLSLGIETLGGLMDTIIPRNSKIPIQLARNYTTSVDGQKNLKITIYQGERDLVQDNIKLGTFILKNIPPMPAGLAKIEIKFNLNADGILSVSAKEIRSGIEQQIEIRSSLKLSDDEIQQRLKDSITNAESDAKNKAKLDSINELNYLILNTKRFINQNKTILNSDELEIMNYQLNNLIQALSTDSKKEIDQCINTFNTITAPIAHKIMDIQIKNSLSRSSVNKI